MAQVHGCSAAVRRRAANGDAQARGRGDARHHAELFFFMLQHPALFDVHFKESRRRFLIKSILHMIGIEAALLQHIVKRPPFPVVVFEKVGESELGLPSVAAPKRLDSSHMKSIISRGRSFWKPSSRRLCITSAAESTPARPSKLPPSGTLSP